MHRSQCSVLFHIALSWPRYSVRSVFVIVTLVGILLGHAIESTRTQSSAIAAIRKVGGIVRYTYEFSDSNVRRLDAGLDAIPPLPKWLTNKVGEDLFYEVSEVGLLNIDDSRMEDLREHLVALTDLSSLVIWGGTLSDDGLQHIRLLRSLERLSISELDITDDALHFVKYLGRLNMLAIAECPISGRGLAGTTNLKCVFLNETYVSDAGLKALAGNTQLVELYLGRTSVTDVGIARLKRAIKNCVISR